jgi:hypothetical protein
MGRGGRKGTAKNTGVKERKQGYVNTKKVIGACCLSRID